MKSKNKNPIHQETDCAKLARRNFYNTSEEDIDVPDGDIEFGKKLYQEQCVGSHAFIGQGPSLISIYGAKGGRQKEFGRYGNKCKGMKHYGWSKQRLLRMLENPGEMFGIESAMLFDDIRDPYARACIVEYLHFIRLTNSESVKSKFFFFK